MLNFNPSPPVKCKNCGKPKGKHKAMDYNCPFGRGNHPNFYMDQFFEPKTTRQKDEQ